MWILAMNGQWVNSEKFDQMGVVARQVIAAEGNQTKFKIVGFYPMWRDEEVSIDLADDLRSKPFAEKVLERLVFRISDTFTYSPLRMAEIIGDAEHHEAELMDAFIEDAQAQADRAFAPEQD